MIIQNNSTGLKFVNIKDGKFSIYQGKDNPPIIADGLEGNITNVSIGQDSYQNKPYDVINVEMRDNNEGYKIKVRLDSGYGRSLALKLLNVDFTQRVKLQPSMQVVNDKKNTSFFVSQGNTNVKQKYTSTNLGPMPNVKKVMFKGEEQVDNTDQLEFMKAELGKLIFNASPSSAVSVASIVEDESSDLPF